MVRRTPGISCEAVPASSPAARAFGGASVRSAACGARSGAAESFVSFIPLFDGVPFTSLPQGPIRPNAVRTLNVEKIVCLLILGDDAHELGEHDCPSAPNEHRRSTQATDRADHPTIRKVRYALRRLDAGVEVIRGN